MHVNPQLQPRLLFMRLVSGCDQKTSLQKLLREELQVLMSDGICCCCCKCCCCKWCCCKCCCCCVKLAHPRPVFILRLKNLTTVLFQKWIFLFQCRLLSFLSVLHTSGACKNSIQKNAHAVTSSEQITIVQLQSPWDYKPSKCMQIMGRSQFGTLTPECSKLGFVMENWGKMGRLHKWNETLTCTILNFPAFS